MRVAISTDNEYVSAHFGRCPSFTIIDIEHNKVVKKEIIENPGHQPGFIPQFLHKKGVNCIIAGGMGMRATQFFAEYDIKTVMGIDGKVDDIIERLVKGELKGGESLCTPGAGKGYGVDKNQCDHPHNNTCGH